MTLWLHGALPTDRPDHTLIITSPSNVDTYAQGVVITGAPVSCVGGLEQLEGDNPVRTSGEVAGYSDGPEGTVLTEAFPLPGCVRYVL